MTCLTAAPHDQGFCGQGLGFRFDGAKVLGFVVRTSMNHLKGDGPPESSGCKVRTRDLKIKDKGVGFRVRDLPR